MGMLWLCNFNKKTALFFTYRVFLNCKFKFRQHSNSLNKHMMS
jgi:hypothetical protein